MDDQNITINRAQKHDIKSLIDIQCAALPRSFITRCGRYFLRNVMYQVALTNSDVLIYTIRNARRIIGFVIYAKSPLFFKQQLSRKKASLLISISMQLIKDPYIFVKCMRMTRTSRIVDTINLPHNCFYLFLIAVDPEQHSLGYGSKLLDRTLSDAATYYNSKSCIVEARTKESYNFYKKNNFLDVGYELRGGTKFYRLLKKI